MIRPHDPSPQNVKLEPGFPCKVFPGVSILFREVMTRDTLKAPLRQTSPIIKLTDSTRRSSLAALT